MGNLIEKVNGHKYELSLAALGISWLAFLKYMRSQNQ